MNTIASVSSRLKFFTSVLLAAVPLLPGSAQTRYSVNVVGYVEVEFLAGSNLVSNPLAAWNNSLSNIFPALPSGSFYVPWNEPAQSFEPANHFVAGTGWTDGTVEVTAFRGGFLWLPAAARVSFAGEPWGLPCVPFPAGLEAFTVFPLASCGFCGDFTDPCPFFPDDGTTLRRWDAANQTWFELAHYIDGLGWVPAEPVTAPGEGALMRAPRATTARVPGGAGGAPIVPPARLDQPRFDGTNFIVQFQAEAGVNYRLQRCTSLGTNGWRTVASGMLPTNGWMALTDADATNAWAFYRLGPDLRLVNPARTDTNFSFQFEAEAATEYVVSRKTVPTDPLWVQIKTIPAGSGGWITVTDSTATNSSGYYRLQHAE